MNEQPTCFVFFSNGDCPKGNACDCWHPPECFLHQEGNCKLRNKCTFKHTDKAGSESRKRINAVVVAKTLDHAHDKVTSLEIHCEGRLSARCVSHSSEINFYRKIGKNIVKKFQLSRIFEIFVKEREKKGPILRIIQQGEQNSRSPNTFCSTCSSKCVQSLVKLTWNLLAKCMEFSQEHV